MVNCIVRPQVYERHRAVVRADPLVMAWGRLERHDRNVNVLVTRMERIAPPAEQAAPRRRARWRPSPACAPPRPRASTSGADGGSLRGVAYLLAAAIIAAMTVTPLPLPPSWLVLSYLSLELSAAPAAGSWWPAPWAPRRGARRSRGRRASWGRASCAAPPATTSRTWRNACAGGGAPGARRRCWRVSPPPAGALYIAAGLLRVNLAIVAGACFAGRLVTYGAGVAAASVAADEIADRLRDSAGPWSVALGIAVLALALWVFGRVDWRLLLEARRLRLRRG